MSDVIIILDKLERKGVLGDVKTALSKIKENKRLIRQNKLAEYLLMFLDQWVPPVLYNTDHESADRALRNYMRPLEGDRKTKKIVRDKVLNAVFTTNIRKKPQDASTTAKATKKVVEAFQPNTHAVLQNQKIGTRPNAQGHKKMPLANEEPNYMLFVTMGMIIGFFILILLLVL